MSYHLTPRISPLLVLRLYKGLQVSDHQMPGLHRMVRDISSRAGITNVPGLWLLPSSRPVAFVTGDRDSSALALSKGILNTLEVDELAGVVAHELSHIAHNDNRIMWFSEVTVKMVKLLSIVGQVMVLINLPAIFAGQRDISLVLLAVVVVSPVLAMLLQLALLRTREFAADTGSAELMGSPKPLIRALGKIEGIPTSLFKRWVTGHREQKGHTLLRTHPPVNERISRLKKLEDDGKPQRTYTPVTEQELVEMLLSGSRTRRYAVEKRDRGRGGAR
ncbi:zinc metalloprotease HtpX [Desulfoluna limicola]|uniref:zinc metalloprotease HtpX n=1 Tax=Desulfoluna limicola TaxID=2810562 RepID=UPI001F1AD5F7|nr:zinc metalloprotease HtpX [Desulfoluna limicola]